MCIPGGWTFCYLWQAELVTCTPHCGSFFFSRLHTVGLRQQHRNRLLTQTLVGGVPSGPGPGSVLVKGVTFVAVISHCVMLAGADQAAAFPLDTLASVTVTLASVWEGGGGGHRGRWLCKTTRYNSSSINSPFVLVDQSMDMLIYVVEGKRRGGLVRRSFHRKELSLPIILRRFSFPFSNCTIQEGESGNSKYLRS